MARSKKACIVFFDEVDAIGGARFDDGVGGDNEVQRTMLEIVNQLDGFDDRGNIKVLMATNRYYLVFPFFYIQLFDVIMKVSQLSAFTVIFRIIDVIMSAHPLVINRDKIKVALLVSIIMLNFIANGLYKISRPDTLDPALLRPGRLDRKVEFGLPDLESRTQIFKIHTRTMNCERDIRFELLARLCPNSTGKNISTTGKFLI
jgi:26S proteasome regulatory subunit T1